MKAMLLDRFGGPEVLAPRDVPAPLPGPDEVRIRVAAAGVNFGDTVVRAGGAPVAIDLPLVPGSEVAGTVEALGAGVKRPELGTRVLAPLFLAGRLGGGYAELATMDAGLLVSLPDDIGFDQAVALSMQGLTAWLLMRQFPVAGRRVLVTAAAGGVGSLVVQLARLGGAATVAAAAGTPEKLDHTLALGADVAVNYDRADWADAVRATTDGHGPDIVFETVGGAIREASFDVLAPTGTMVIYGGSSGGGFASDAIAPDRIGALINRNQSVAGFSMWPLLGDRAAVRSLLDACYDELFALVREGRLVVTASSRPLAEAADSHRALQARRTIGKTVLMP
jgi:NADPH2:quinone reductase